MSRSSRRTEKQSQSAAAGPRKGAGSVVSGARKGALPPRRSRSGWLFLSAVGLCGLVALGWWLGSRGPGSSLPPSSAGVRAGAGTASGGAQASRATPSTPLPGASPATPGAEQGLAEDASRNDDLAIYAARPMSAVAHAVARGWGLSDDPQQLGLVGAYVFVKPDISNQQLTQLCRDIHAYHRNAKVLGVRIYDSEEAARYSRRSDGGVLASQHLVARVSRDASVGVDTCWVRGEQVKP